MGWGLKIGLFFVALISAAFRAWIITIPLLAYLLLPPLLARRKGSSGFRGRDANAEPTTRGGLPVSKVLGSVLLVFSLVAIAARGTLSPIVLAFSGFLLLLGPKFGSQMSSRVRPVQDSMLLRGSILPFKWFALAEAKVSTRDPEGALSGVSERLLLLSVPAPRIFMVFSASSLGRKGAEEGILKRMQDAARGLGPLGIYLLPLDGAEALEVSRIEGARISVGGREVQQFLASANYAAVAVEAEGGFVTAMEFYGRNDDEKACSLLSPPRAKPRGSPMLRELLHATGQRMSAPQPDGYVTFLSSMAATEGETLGQRITQAVQGSDNQLLLVASLGSPQVELSRAQLRAVSWIYE